MFQAFAVQPGIAATQQAAENVVAGKPVTEGIAEGIPGSVLMTAVPGAAHAVLNARSAAKTKTAVGENLDKEGGTGDEAKVAGAQADVAGDVGGQQATDIEGIGRELEAGTRKPTPALDIEGKPLPAEGEAVAPEPPPEPVSCARSCATVSATAGTCNPAQSCARSSSAGNCRYSCWRGRAVQSIHQLRPRRTDA